MRSKPDTTTANSFAIGGEVVVSRLGYGAGNVLGQTWWEQPSQRRELLLTLRRLPEIGVTLIDSGRMYASGISDTLIRVTLHPYDGLFLATKAALQYTMRHSGRPLDVREYLLQQARKGLGTLGIERHGLWQLHHVNPAIPYDELLSAVLSLKEEGIIYYAGLIEPTIAQIEQARTLFPVATVQSVYNVADRRNEELLNYCERHGIGFIASLPLAGGYLARGGALLNRIATNHDATPAQIALAWLLKRSPVILAIPGAAKVRHVDENIGAVNVCLSEDEFAELDRAGKQMQPGSREGLFNNESRY